MHVSLENRVIELQRLKLPEPVFSFLIDLDSPKGLEYLFECPFYFYTPGAPENPAFWPDLEQRSLIPLWEHMEQVFAVDISKPSPEYISFYLETPDDPTIHGDSVYLPIWYMLELHVWEYGGEAQEASDALKFARTLSLPHLSTLEVLLSNFEKCSDTQIQQYRELLRA